MEAMLLTIISFLLVLTVLVLVHELGHYLVAKFFNVKVEEFGFGFPPKAWGKKIGETVYSINWLPIGGFVKLYGEDDAGSGKINTSRIGMSGMGGPDILSGGVKRGAKDLNRAFFTQSIWKRFLIVFAGVFMNFVLATVLLTYLVMAQGIPNPGKDVFIAAVVKNSPADKAGVQVGDKVVSVDSVAITSSEQLISYTKHHLGQQITLKIQDTKNKIQNTEVIPRVHYPSNEGAMGVAVVTNVIVTKYPWYQAPFVGLKEACYQSWMILVGLGQLVRQLVTRGQVPQGLAGPVGIAQITGQFVQMGINPTLSLLALLSLNLAILNVLPIPALDGGRLFFIVFEAVFRRKISPKAEGYAHAIGMAVLLALIVLITFHDVVRIATGGSLLPK
ncbi:MAG TPA: RIP metalloprotease RseP [Candidatus Eisenbacteria bacterium]|nr:RIP metalloprotease RseP [Candidatus Eisenbacteria bacterium]